MVCAGVMCLYNISIYIYYKIYTYIVIWLSPCGSCYGREYLHLALSIRCIPKMKSVPVKEGRLHNRKHSEQGVTIWVYFVYPPIHLFLNIDAWLRLTTSTVKTDMFLCFWSWHSSKRHINSALLSGASKDYYGPE